MEDIQRQERHTKESSSRKKEVDFIPHTPPKVKSKNVAGPPVYYPPGSAEFTKKEESSAAMSQAGVSQLFNVLYRAILYKFTINKNVFQLQTLKKQLYITRSKS